jgi:integrase
MGRTLHRLSPTKVRIAKDTGMYADGGGLYLQVKVGADGRINKSWLFRYAIPETAISANGIERQKERQMGLGSLDTISLAEAREATVHCRKLRVQGIDPIAARDAERTKAALEAARAMTFDQCRDAYIAAHRAGWRNVKHASQWTNTLTTYATPVFGKLPVAAIDTALVMKVVEPIWAVKSETASRVRGRIEVILDWATVRGFRQGDNPARWRGHLDKLLPARSKVRKVVNHAALPYGEIGPFMADLREREGIAARALEFTILTAARTGEVIGARWDEINLKASVWTLPADRMKGSREHRVPLTEAALGVLEAMRQLRQNEFVFPGDRRAMLSNMAMEMLLRRMGRDVTVHGFRSTFRDWAAERTNFPSEVAEAALAHVVGDKVEAAYRRGDLFEKRRKLMGAWASYCETGDQEEKVVLPIHVR